MIKSVITKSLTCIFLLFFTLLQNINSQKKIDIIYNDGITQSIEATGKRLKYSKDGISLSINRKTVKYTPSEIQQVRSGEFKLISSKIHNQNGDSVYEFLEPLLSGYISLYRSYDNKGKKLFYLQVKDSVIQFIPKKYFKFYINYLFSDCNSLNIQMDEKSFQRFEYKLDDWLHLVNIYNKCKGFGDGTVMHKDPVFKYESFLSLGGSSSFININKKPYTAVNFNNKYTPYAGFGFGVECFDFLGLNFSANFHNYQSDAHFTARGARLVWISSWQHTSIPVNVDVNLKYSLIAMELPLFIRARVFSSKKIYPYLECGPVVSTILSNKSVATAVDDYVDQGSYKDKIYFDKFNPALYFGGGMGFKINNRNYNVNFGLTRIRFNSQPIHNYGFSGDGTYTFNDNFNISIRMKL